MSAKQNETKNAPIKEIRLWISQRWIRNHQSTSRLVHPKSSASFFTPVRHNWQGSAGESFPPYKVCKFVNFFSLVIQEDRMKLVEQTLKAYFHWKTENSSRRKPSCASQTNKRRIVEFARKLVRLRRSRKQLYRCWPLTEHQLFFCALSKAFTY